MLVFDALDEKKPPATAERELIIALLKQRKVEFAHHCKGMAFIFDSILQRMALRGVFLVAKLPTEIKVFANRKEALAWSRERLALKDPDLAPKTRS